MSATLDRTTFTFRRTLEYFSLSELQAQTGQSYTKFPIVIVKELVDNALDECECVDVKPVVELSAIEEDEGTVKITIADNGKGIPPETVEKILDFDTRTTSKAFYRTPTRGQLGNALKTVIGIPYALSKQHEREETGTIEIISHGIKHTICVKEYAGQPQPKHNTIEESADNSEGTVITVQLPVEVMYEPRWDTSKGGFNDIKRLVYGYALLNPHVSFSYFESRNVVTDEHGTIERQNSQYESPAVADPAWRRFYATDLPSPHWFEADSLKVLINAHIQNGAIKPFGTFIREFRGLSSSAKAKAVSQQFKSVKTIADLTEGGMSDLLAVMKAATKPPNPSVLGRIGQDAIRTRLNERHEITDFRYKRIEDHAGDLPFIVEAAAAIPDQDDNKDYMGGDRLQIYTGLNFTPAYDDPFKDTWFTHSNSTVRISGTGLRGLLQDLKVTSDDPFTFILHVTTPVLEFRDRAKSTVFIPSKIGQAIAEATYACCKEWYEHKKREEKDAAKEEKREEHEREERDKEERREQWSLKDAVFKVLPDAISKASSGGRYRYSARSLFYQVRPLIQSCTDKQLRSGYFSQTLLNQYEEIYGEIPGLYRDPRGYFLEPHTGVKIQLGTLAVEKYIPPDYLFNKILYVEKKGLLPIIEDADLHNRYDIGIIAAEGYAVRAAKDLIMKILHYTKSDITVLCLHDCDIDGYMIAITLQRETPARPTISIDVMDIGLFINTVIEKGYECEKVTRFADMPQELREQLTEEEQKFLIDHARTSYGGKKTYYGWRVELNALTSAELLNYIEAKLVEHGVTEKECPPDEKILSESKDSFDSDLRLTVEEKIKSLLSVDELATVIVKELGGDADFSEMPDKLKEQLKDNPPRAWKDILNAFIGEQTEELVENNTDIITEIVKNRILSKGDSP
jgi:DNA topoisomerase VI subunit B